jgi:hypothetical protein
VLACDLLVIESLLILFDHVVFIVIFQLFLKVLVIIIFQHEVLLIGVIIHELIDVLNHKAVVHYVGCVALGVTADVLRNLLTFRYHLNLLLL